MGQKISQLGWLQSLAGTEMIEVETTGGQSQRITPQQIAALVAQGTNQASNVPANDAGGYFESTTVEGQLQELGARPIPNDSNLRPDLASTDAGKGASLVSFLQSGVGAVLRSLYDKFLDHPSAFDFMTAAERADARAGGLNLDLTAAINKALVAHKCVRLPAGNFRVDGPLQFTQSGQRLIGAGRGATMLWSKSATAKMITFTSGINDVQIGRLTLDRTSVTPVAGASGIDCSNIAVLGQSRFYDLNIRHQYIGMALGSTDFSFVQDVICERNESHGIYLTNTSATALQWSLSNILCQLNGGCGINVVSQAFGGGATSVGSWRNVNTYANSAGGIWVNGGTGRRIESFRLDGFFIGEDGDHGLYLDTFNTIPHTIRNGYIEITGKAPTGPLATTPASNVGDGLHATANNAHIDLTNVHSDGNSYNGFNLKNTSVNMPGCSGVNNGSSLVTGKRYGVETSTTTRCVINGGWYGCTSGITNQQYGVVAGDGNLVSMIGVDLTGNVTGTHACLTNATSLTVLGCLPNSVENRLPNAGLAVGSAAAAAAVGSINVSGEVARNGINYTNP